MDAKSRGWDPSKPVALLIGVLSIWPGVYFVAFIGSILFMFANAQNQRSMDLFRVILPVHILTMLLMFALTAVYVVHVFKSERLTSDKRLLWVVVLFFGNIVAFPIYWWLYMRPGAQAP
jgi:hypothetical protein